MKSMNLLLRRTTDFDHSPREQSAWSLRLSNWGRQFLHQIVAPLIEPAEPHIREKVDRHGQVHWYAYDAMSDRTFHTTSEDEMRQWIEQRYYQTATYCETH